MNQVSVGQEYYDKRFRGDGHSPRVVSVTMVDPVEGISQIKNNYTGRKVWIKTARLLNASRFELVVSKPVEEAVAA